MLVQNRIGQLDLPNFELSLHFLFRSNLPVLGRVKAEIASKRSAQFLNT
jgi:hypothetical protein